MSAEVERLRADVRAAYAEREEMWERKAAALRERDEARRELAEAREAVHVASRIVATSSRDWSLHADDAWLYALLVGWDCEMPEHADGAHDEIDCSGPEHLEDFADRFGWTEGGVAKLRGLRSALAALNTSAPTTRTETA